MAKKLTLIELTKEDFSSVNDEDCFGVFREKRDKAFDKLPSSKQVDFHHHVFDKEQVEKLYSKYDRIVIMQDDTLWGFKKKSFKLIYETDGMFEAAQKLK